MSAFVLPEDAENALCDAEKAVALLATLAASCQRLEVAPEELAAFCSMIHERIATARAAARFEPTLN